VLCFVFMSAISVGIGSLRWKSALLHHIFFRESTLTSWQERLLSWPWTIIIHCNHLWSNALNAHFSRSNSQHYVMVYTKNINIYSTCKHVFHTRLHAPQLYTTGHCTVGQMHYIEFNVWDYICNMLHSVYHRQLGEYLCAVTVMHTASLNIYLTSTVVLLNKKIIITGHINNL